MHAVVTHEDNSHAIAVPRHELESENIHTFFERVSCNGYLEKLPKGKPHAVNLMLQLQLFYQCHLFHK